MALDAGIYGNLLARPKSAMEYQQDYAAMDDAREARKLNALQMQDTRAKLADAELTRTDQTAYRNALAALPAGASQDQLISTIEGVRNPYAMTQARELRKDQLEAQAKQTEISRNKATEAHSNAQTDQIKAEQKQKVLSRAMDDVMAAKDPQQAMQLVQQYSSILDPAAVQGMTRELMGVSTPDQLDSWKYRRVAAIHGLKTAEEMRLAKLDKASTLANRDLIEDPRNPGQYTVNEPLVKAKSRIAAAGAQQGPQPVQYVKGADGQYYPLPSKLTPGGAAPTTSPVMGPDGKPLAGEKKAGEGMSATLQKELVEADDLMQNSQNVGSALRQALKLNDKAYSGYQATARAKVRSNLPGQDPSADATIELENLIAGQGLESLRSIFGGNPTEGERKILLDLQASTDKTPAQRKAIIERAIQAADRRQTFAKNRAAAIRGGTYLTQGADPVGAPAQPAAPAGQPRVVNFGDLQ